MHALIPCGLYPHLPENIRIFIAFTNWSFLNVESVSGLEINC